MIKKKGEMMNRTIILRRLVSLMVIASFVWMLQVTAAPLKALGAKEENSNTLSATYHDSQGAYERSINAYTHAYKRSHKSSALPLIIGVVAAAAIAAILILVVKKTKYDITGTWDVAYKWSNITTSHYIVTFTGSTKSGTFNTSEGDYSDTGHYTQSGENVSWTFSHFGHAVYTGTFTDKNDMSGNMKDDANNTGTWTAVRTSSSSMVKPPLSTTGIPGLGGAGRLN